MPGYWWQCSDNSAHRLDSFRKAHDLPLVEFLYDLEQRGWDQNRLSLKCSSCQQSVMRMTYEFPRSIDQLTLTVRHIVGLRFRDEANYMPMIWEASAANGGESSFDFKYVNRHQKKGTPQAYGLAGLPYLASEISPHYSICTKRL